MHNCCRREIFQADLKAIGQNTSFSWLSDCETPQVSQSLSAAVGSTQTSFSTCKITVHTRKHQTLTLPWQKTAGHQLARHCCLQHSLALPRALPSSSSLWRLCFYYRYVVSSHLILKLRQFSKFYFLLLRMHVFALLSMSVLIQWAT